MTDRNASLIATRQELPPLTDAEKHDAFEWLRNLALSTAPNARFAYVALRAWEETRSASSAVADTGRNPVTCEHNSRAYQIAEMEGQPLYVPLCAAHAQTWFTERDGLQGGMDSACIVCAHNVTLSSTAEIVVPRTKEGYLKQHWTEAQIDAAIKEYGGGDIDCCIQNMGERIKQLQSLPSATRETGWHPASVNPTSEDYIFIVRDKDGQLAFSLWEDGKWNHVPDADCGDVAEWFALPRSDSCMPHPKEKP